MMIEDVAERLRYSSWATIFRAISSPRMVSLAIDRRSTILLWFLANRTSWASLFVTL
jgi:hypothetical protein